MPTEIKPARKADDLHARQVALQIALSNVLFPDTHAPIHFEFVVPCH